MSAGPKWDLLYPWHYSMQQRRKKDKVTGCFIKRNCKIPVQWQGETLGFTGTGCSSSMYNIVLFLRAKSSNPTQPGVSRMTAYYSHQCVQEIGADIGPRQSCAYITWNCITRGCAQNLTIKNIFLFISVSSYLYSCSWGQNISTQSLVTCCPLLLWVFLLHFSKDHQ